MFLKAGRFLVEIVKVLTKAITPFAAMALGQLLLMQEYLIMAGLAIGFSMIGVGLYGPPKLSSIKTTKNTRNAAQLLGCFIVGMVMGSGLLPMSVGYPLAIIGIVPWGRTGRLVKFLGVAIPLTGLSVPLLEHIMSDPVVAQEVDRLVYLTSIVLLGGMLGGLSVLVLHISVYSFGTIVFHVVWISAGCFASAALLGILDKKEASQSELSKEELLFHLDQLYGNLHRARNGLMELIVNGERMEPKETTRKEESSGH